MMKRFWVYRVSFLVMALGIGGTFFFFMKTPTEEVASSPEIISNQPLSGRNVLEGPKELSEKVDSPSSGKTNLSKEIPKPVPQIETQKLIPVKDADKKLALAKELKSSGKLTEAHEILKELILASNITHEEVQKEFWDVNTKLIFSDSAIPGWRQEITVGKGDSLFMIAKQYHTTVDLLEESNHLSSKNLHPGEILHVFTGQISLVASKSLNILNLKINGEVVKTYQVGTGVGGSTPVGEFKVINKLKDPSWHHDGKTYPFGDPKNILGTRWMGLNFKGYGIHGTLDPTSVGKQSSAGCIRLKNEEVEELYKIVPVGTVVSIVE
ncbi:MAG: L,D-transpeptidase family protein [Chlamydiae bacterium]|nr:L,D-transpeptidase family protein [Chlamydiota bacterium]MBI3276423.1 L,D-transpeptidase family protein [Chlamydiota bacterium]